MPPWHIDRTIGIQLFKNDRSLSDEEVRIISDWVNAGAPEVNSADLPPSREFADSGEWSIGEPDDVVTWEYNVTAVGADLFGDIYSTDLVGKFSEGRYITEIQTRYAEDADSYTHLRAHETKEKLV